MIYDPTFKMYLLPLLLFLIHFNSTYFNRLAVWWVSHIISPPTLWLSPSEFDLASSHFDLNIQCHLSVISPTDLVVCICYHLLSSKYCGYSFGGFSLAFLNLTSDLGLCD